MKKSLKIASPADHHRKDLAADFGLENHGLMELKRVYWNLTEEALYEEFVFRGEGQIVNHGRHAGRDRQVDRARGAGQVHRPRARDRGPASGGASTTARWRPRSSPTSSAACRPTCRARRSSSRTSTAATTPSTGSPCASSPQDAWQSLFARNMFITPKSRQEYKEFVPEFTLIACPHFKCDPRIDGTRSADRAGPQLRRPQGAGLRLDVRRRDQEDHLHGDELPASRSTACWPCTARPTSTTT